MISQEILQVFVVFQKGFYLFCFFVVARLFVTVNEVSVLSKPEIIKQLE